MFDFIVRDASFMCVTSENGKHWALTTHHPPERIVKCKDCVYYLESCEYFDWHPACRHDGCEIDGFDAVMTYPDGFCAWGEPREYTEPTITGKTEEDSHS